MSIKPLVVDWKGLKKMGRPFCRAETDRGEKAKRYPPITSIDKPPPSSGAMLTEPWLRVGAEPLHLIG
jgi:hypothetical protein